VKRWVPALAVAVLLPLTLGVTFANEWGSYYTTRPSQPVEVAAGASADFAGTGWQVAQTRTVLASSAPGQAYGLPEGTQLVSVVVDVTPGTLVDGESPYCIATLQQRDGGAVVRNWSTAIFSGIDYFPEEPLQSGCSTEQTGPYSFEAWFVVPDDAGSELSLSLELVNELPRYLRLAL
jgi:hypothetical protein